LFTLADVAFYLLILSRIGPEALTVTTGATINFMRKPAPGQLFGDARILKQGTSLIVGDVLIYNGDDDARTAPVAHAQMTYSVPPTRGRS
jgi:acyl-coenzyme A thioesterase PaaI-like protein